MILHTAQTLVSNNGLAAEPGRSLGGGLEFRVLCVPTLLDVVTGIKEKEEVVEEEATFSQSQPWF